MILFFSCTFDRGGSGEESGGAAPSSSLMAFSSSPMTRVLCSLVRELQRAVEERAESQAE